MLNPTLYLPQIEDDIKSDLLASFYESVHGSKEQGYGKTGGVTDI